MGTITIIKDDKLFKADAKQAKQLLQEIFEIEKPVSNENEFSERLTRREAAKFLDCSYQTMYNYSREGVLMPMGHGRKQFYLKSDLIEFLNTKNQ